MKDLINRINTFDTYYMMSDDHAKWCKWNNEEIALKKELNNTSDDQRREIAAALNENGKASEVGSLLIAYVAKLPTKKRDTSHLRDIMSDAWGILKMGAAKTIGAALKLAWKKFRLMGILMTGEVSFKFIKANGELREAKGTTDGRMFGYVAPVRRYVNALV